MTTISMPHYDEHPDDPHTHVLVVAAGLYRHLPDEEGRTPLDDPPAPANVRFDLPQLTSPPASARHVARWVLDNLRNDDAPLGTVEVLISDPPPGESPARPGPALEWGEGSLPALDPASMECFMPAFRAWRRRCNANPGNVAMFYFCGHGMLINGDRILLLEDYGSPDLDDPFKAAINWNQALKSLDTLGYNHACVQCYFIDACGNLPYGYGDYGRPVGEALLPAQPDQTADPDQERSIFVSYATVEGYEAYGTTNAPSRFAAALVASLDGRACWPNPEGDRWVVDTLFLGAGITQSMRWLFKMRKGSPQQALNTFSGSGRIHYRLEPPLIPVCLSLEPDAAAGQGHLLLEADPPARWQSRRDLEAGEWTLEEVPAGSYCWRGAFDGGYPPFETHFRVVPPGPYECRRPLAR